MKNRNNRLFALLLLIACCAAVGFSFSTAVADGHRDDHEEPWEGEDDWDEEEEWEDEEWGMEEAFFEIEMMSMHFDLFAGLIEMVGNIHEITQDPSLTAIMALTSVEEYLEPEMRAEFLDDELDHVQDPAVRRAIHGMLAETYAEMDETDKAMEHLSVLIRGKN